MPPTIHLALTHDWELRGDGSGDIEEIQFAPLRRLLRIYQQTGVRTTFLPDVMQQLRFRSLQSEHAELKSLADSWDDHAREAFGHGHDIQLHLHPQWLNGEYENGRWRLPGKWSIVKYDQQTARSMLEKSKYYLEQLLRPLNQSYRCVAFRAGALAAAPSDHLFETLASLDMQLDVSIAPGLVANEHNLGLDYRNCQETFLPFYPHMKDARKISDKPEPVVCVPLHHFYGSRRAVTRQNLALARRRMFEGPNGSIKDAGENKERGSRLSLAYQKLIKPALSRKYFVSDTGRLNYSLMQEMLASIRQRARSSGLENVPVVLTNHPKDIRDWNGLERFV
ncbi:MAG TPA: hypothetical protein VIU65_08690, partial [Pyrinomonadaceae bacterium]